MKSFLQRALAGALSFILAAVTPGLDGHVAFAQNAVRGVPVAPGGFNAPAVSGGFNAPALDLNLGSAPGLDLNLKLDLGAPAFSIAVEAQAQAPALSANRAPLPAAALKGAPALRAVNRMAETSGRSAAANGESKDDPEAASRGAAKMFDGGYDQVQALDGLAEKMFRPVDAQAQAQAEPALEEPAAQPAVEKRAAESVEEPAAEPAAERVEEQVVPEPEAAPAQQQAEAEPAPAVSAPTSEPDLEIDERPHDFDLKRGVVLSWAQTGVYLALTAVLAYHAVGVTPHTGFQVAAGFVTQTLGILGGLSLVASVAGGPEKIKRFGLIGAVAIAAAAVLAAPFIGPSLTGASAVAVIAAAGLHLWRMWNAPAKIIPKQKRKSAVFLLSLLGAFAGPLAILTAVLNMPWISFGVAATWAFLGYEITQRLRDYVPAPAPEKPSDPVADEPVVDEPVEETPSDPVVDEPIADEPVEEAPSDPEPVGDILAHNLALLRGKMFDKLVVRDGLNAFKAWVDKPSGRMLAISKERRANTDDGAYKVRKFEIRVERRPEDGAPVGLSAVLPTGLSKAAVDVVTEALRIRSQELKDAAPALPEAPRPPPSEDKAPEKKPRRRRKPPVHTDPITRGNWPRHLTQALYDSYGVQNAVTAREDGGTRVWLRLDKGRIKGDAPEKKADLKQIHPVFVDVFFDYDGVTDKHEMRFGRMNLPAHYEPFRRGIGEAFAYLEKRLQDEGLVQTRYTKRERQRSPPTPNEPAPEPVEDEPVADEPATPAPEAPSRRELERRVRQRYLRDSQLARIPTRYRGKDAASGWALLAERLDGMVSWELSQERRLDVTRTRSGETLLITDTRTAKGETSVIRWYVSDKGRLRAVNYKGPGAPTWQRLGHNALTKPAFESVRDGLAWRMLETEAKRLRPILERDLAKRKVPQAAIERLPKTYQDAGAVAGWNALVHEVDAGRPVDWTVTSPNTRSGQRTLSADASNKGHHLRVTDARTGGAAEKNTTIVYIANAEGALVEAYYEGPAYPGRVRLSVNARTKAAWDDVKSALGKKAAQNRRANR